MDSERIVNSHSIEDASGNDELVRFVCLCDRYSPRKPYFHFSRAVVRILKDVYSAVLEHTASWEENICRIITKSKKRNYL